MITILVGKSGSGKSSISKELQNNYGYERLITCTTRPKRNGETDGEDYYFLSNSEFQSKLDSDEFLESTKYCATFGSVSYGSLKESYQKSDKNRVIVLNPDGVKALISYKSSVQTRNSIDNLRIIFLDVSDRTLRVRLFSRGDLPVEIERRLEADTEDFETLEPLFGNCIEVLDVGKKSIEEIAKEIASN